MKISINWLKDFVNLDGISNEEIVKRFNLATAEIEGVEFKGRDTKGVVFGKILSVCEHPSSKKLHILKVDLGSRVEQIVCGAPNVYEGMITCVATVHGSVCGHDIGVATLAGVESRGMCCSYAELGIGSDDSGIIDVKENVKIGEDIKKVWAVDDAIFEIDNKTLTNRPDLWGHYGLARELACVFDRELKKPELEDFSKYQNLPKISINNESENCFRYSAISVKNVTKKVSPTNMMIRLNYCGMRDINLLADITNYVMLELGQPMHAFDSDKVSAINVLNAKKGDKLLTLEGEEHEILENSVVICDQNRTPCAIAGIKGGMVASISNTTTNVLFESATFSAERIRKTSRSIGLVTDSSLRYEKSLDPELTSIALARIIRILKDIDENCTVSSSFSDCYSKKYQIPVIKISEDFITNRIGMKISKSQIIKILTKLDFKVVEHGEELIVTDPSFRATKDVSMKEDLVEEIARIYGYDNIIPTPLAFEPKPIKLNKNVSEEYEVKKLLATKYNAVEVHSYIWDFKDFNDEHGIESVPVVSLMDSSNAGQSGIRRELLPTMLKVVSENKNSYDDIRVFEVGRVAESLDKNNLVVEKKKLAVCFASKSKQKEELFEDLKTFAFDYINNELQLDAKLVEGEKPNYMHPTNTFRILASGIDVGYIGVVHPKTSTLIDKKLNIIGLEIDFGKLLEQTGIFKRAIIPSKYQSVNFDVSILTPKDMNYGELENVLSRYNSKISKGFKLKEIYENDSLNGQKSTTVCFELCADDHTLQGSEIDEFLTGLVKHLEEFNLKIRNN